jgi:hypothetical protein
LLSCLKTKDAYKHGIIFGLPMEMDAPSREPLLDGSTYLYKKKVAIFGKHNRNAFSRISRPDVEARIA